jgi:hypothetical protein
LIIREKASGPPQNEIALWTIDAKITISKRAGEGTRTPDQLITNQLLYQLSYTGDGIDPEDSSELR